MARIFQTGFEMGTPPDTDIGSNFSALGTSNTRGAWSTYYLAGTNNQAGWLWDASTSEFYFGIGMCISTNPNDQVVNFNSPNSINNVRLEFDVTQKVIVKRGDGTVLGSTSMTVPFNSTWFYVTGHIIISDTVGVVSIDVNGVNGLSLTSQDTRNDAGANGDKCDRMLLKPVSFVGMDDIWINDTTGTQNTGASGDIRISAYIPNASGDVTGFTPTSGSNYTNVDERPANDATDIVAATGTTLYDLYNIPNTSGVATVQAVTTWIRAQKSDAGAKSFAFKLKSASTEDTGADVALSTSWKYYRKNYSIDPTDSAAWTPGKVDALQIGVKAR